MSKRQFQSGNWWFSRRLVHIPSLSLFHLEFSLLISSVSQVFKTPIPSHPATPYQPRFTHRPYSCPPFESNRGCDLSSSMDLLGLFWWQWNGRTSHLLVRRWPQVSRPASLYNADAAPSCGGAFVVFMAHLSNQRMGSSCCVLERNDDQVMASRLWWILCGEREREGGGERFTLRWKQTPVGWKICNIC